MWFGTRGYAQDVPTPAFNADFTKVGWSTSTQYLNGGASVRKSTASHKVYNMAWNLASRDSLRPIIDFSDGLFGTGLIYFHDPMTLDRNVLPQHWAFPAQAANDAPILVGTVRPSTTPTPANNLHYPSTSVVYTLSGSPATQSLYLPIPPGYVAWVGAHGSADGAGGLRVRPVISGLNNAPDEFPALLTVTDPTRVNASYSSSIFEGLELAIAANPAGTPVATSVTLSGLIVQMLRIGATPQPGGFISGQGHSGCQFKSEPAQVAYSAGLDKMGLTATLIETGGWQ